MLLHITILAEVKCALDMLDFAKNNPSVFYGDIFYPMIICVMKLIGGLQTEISNILMMVESKEIESVVKDFIALGVIAEIDDLMLICVGAV